MIESTTPNIFILLGLLIVSAVITVIASLLVRRITSRFDG